MIFVTQHFWHGDDIVTSTAISAIDIALWDIAGKHLNVPIHTLLGGKVRDKIAVYATGLYYTEEEFSNIEFLLSEARSYVEAGFLGMKTKIGRLSIEKDVARVKALRDEIGYDLKLMVDANQSYNATSAIRSIVSMTNIKFSRMAISLLQKNRAT